MGIVLYQLAIAMIMIVTRVVAPQGLLVAALILTAFTGINVFWPPLIVLQLVVVWGMFALLNKANPA